MEITRFVMNVDRNYTSKLKKVVMGNLDSDDIEEYNYEGKVYWKGDIRLVKYNLRPLFKLINNRIIRGRIHIQINIQMESRVYEQHSFVYEIKDIDDFNLDYIILRNLTLINDSKTSIITVPIVLNIRYERYGYTKAYKRLEMQKPLIDKLSDTDYLKFKSMMYGILYCNNLNDMVELIEFLYVLLRNRYKKGHFIDVKEDGNANLEYLKSKLSYFGYDENFDYNDKLDLNDINSIGNYLIQNIIDDLFLHKNNALSIGEIEDCFDAYLKCLSKEK